MAEELFKKDPATYAAMKVPYENVEATNVAMEGFRKELAELRQKYKVTNFIGCAYGEFIAEDGDPAPFFLLFFFGNWAEAESMAAYLLGHEQHNRQERVANMLSQRGFLNKPPRGK